MKLYNVDLRDMNCVDGLYCMRRTGFTEDLYDFFALPEDGYCKDLSVGDILVWHKDAHHTWLPMYMSEDSVFCKYHIKDRHYAVYEGHGAVTDAILDNGYAIIRKRLLGQLRPFHGVIRNTWSRR